VPHTDPADQPPELVARRYRIVDRIGRGGQGHVYRALDELSGAHVALKLVEKGKRSGTALREAAVLRALQLPGVARLLDEGTWNDQHFLVTELIDGQPFPGVPRPAPWDVLVPPLRRLLDAIGRVHRAGVVHGDLKPANVLVEADGDVRLLDFGMAHARSTVLRELAEQRTGGTLHYLAPEVIDGRRPEPASDLFAIGVMVLRSLTDTVPWRGHDVRELVRARWKSAPLLPSALGIELPPGVQDTLASMLALDPDRRPDSAAAALAGFGLEGSAASLTLPWDADGRPLDPDALAQVFAGPDRILHLPSTAAGLLHKATGGARASVDAELRAWVDAGLATVKDDHIVVSRETLEHLRAQSLLPLAPSTGAPQPGDAGALRVLRAIAVAGDRARPALLSAALGMPPATLDAVLARLSASGAAHADAIGRLVDDTGGSVLADLGEGGRIDLHSRIAAALPARDPARLRHLLAAGAPAAAIVDAATVAADQHRRDGHLADALAVAELAFQVLRNEPYAAGRAARLVDLYTLAAVATELPPTLAHAAWELRRLPRLPTVDVRAALLDASRAALSGRAEQALELVAALPQLADRDLDLLVPTIMFQAARALPLEGEEFLLERIAARLGDPRDADADARLAGWQGHLRHRQGRFEEAARLHATSRRGRGALHQRVAAALDQARALLAAGRHRDARVQATQARLLAEECRDARLEAQAWALLRRVALQQGSADAPDRELVSAVHALGAPALSGEVALTEAMIARSTGYEQADAELAMQAKAGFHAAGELALAVLAAAVAADAGDATGLWWAREHFDEVDPDAHADILLQAAALLHHATGADDWAAKGRRVATRLGAVDLSRPREVMPLAQALHELRG